MNILGAILLKIELLEPKRFPSALPFFLYNISGRKLDTGTVLWREQPRLRPSTTFAQSPWAGQGHTPLTLH